MAILPTKDAIVRFDENEDRLNTFINSYGTYSTNSGLPAVETLPSFMQRNSAALNLLASTNVKGAWAASTTYSVWDEVQYSGTWYRCVVAHTSTGTFDSSKWRISQGVTSGQLSSGSGASLVGYGATTVKDILDSISLSSYDDLRSYSGLANSVFISGYSTTSSSSGIAGLFVVDNNDSTSPDNGATIIVSTSGKRWKRNYSDFVNVQWFGAKGDGVTDDTVAIQAAFTWLASVQSPTISSWTTTLGHIHFPQGIYKISNVIKVRGYVVISGVGTAYVAGTTIRQYATDTNIFAFYGDIATNRNLGTCVRDINFEFATNAGSKSGYALYYPKFSDIDGSTLSSNSHYIRNCRFGGFYRYGRFLFAVYANDIELSGNVIDVCLDGNPAIQIGSQSSTSGCSDVRILGNDFFDCDVGVWLANAKAVTITGNNFSNQQNSSGRSAIKLGTDTGTENAGYISGISITGNSFWAQYSCLSLSGSAVNINYSNNIHQDCLNYPIVCNGTVPFYRYKISNNTFHLANGFSVASSGTYPNSQALLFFAGAKMYDSEICDNSIDANGLNSVVSIFNDQTSDSWFGTGMTIRNNIIKNNTSYQGAYYCFVPTTTKELVVENLISVNGYPTNLPVLNFSSNGFQIGDYVTFDCDYQVICEKSGTNTGVTVGRIRVSIARLASAGISSTKWNITNISNIGDDYNGTGGGAIPTVTFSVQVSPNPYLLVSVNSTIGTPVTTTVKIKALNFTSSGVASVKSS